VQDFYLGTGHIQAPVAHRILDEYFAGGGRHLDTARVYDDNEEILGEWIRTRGVAADVRLLTKGGHPDMPGWAPRLSEKDVLADARKSLSVLGLGQVDVYLLHRDDPATPIAEIANTLRAIVSAGYARSIGVSNWSAARVRELVAELDSTDGPRVGYISNYFGLARVGGGFIPGAHSTDPDLLNVLHEHQIHLVAWMPRAHGYFAGASGPRLSAFDTPESRRRRDLLHEVAGKHGVDPGGLLTRWLMIVDPHITPVFSTTRPEGVLELFRDAADTQLDRAAHELTDRVGRGWTDAGAFTG
jgi:aryl-alcohol dehydrogenase-like predicted oxidoreductase